jgi:hypothetical protein
MMNYPVPYSRMANREGKRSWEAEIENKRPVNRGRTRRKKKGGESKQSTGVVLLGLSVLLLLIAGSATLNQGGRILVRRGWPLHATLFRLARPMVLLFGQAAYLIPFFVAFIGIFYVWHSNQSNRQSRVVRLSVTLPLISIFFAGIGKVVGWPTSWGGLIGHYYFDYILNFAGAVFGWFVGMVILSLLVLSVWGRLYSIKGWTKRFSKDIRKALKYIKVRLLPRLAVLAKKPTASPTPEPKSPKQGPNENPFLLPPVGIPSNKAPWDPVDDPQRPGEVSGPAPLPEPAFQDPLPLEILPDPPAGSLKRQQLLESVPHLQEKIIEVIDRTSQIRLLKGGCAPVVGLNSVVFEFTKSTGQSLPVGAVERSLKDIGLETGRAPARLTIQDKIRIEIPLLQGERSFAPIKPLLGEAMPSELTKLAAPLTYLIGRRQDGSPFQLGVEDAKHVLVGGGTGGGKSVLLHAIIFGIIFRYPPSRVRLTLVDHKMIEFSAYKGLPHLWYPVVTDQHEFAGLVEFLWAELERRKKALVEDYNAKFPAILTIVDEFAEYDSRRLIRLIAEARALDMFFILATQHPTKENISTSIKANLITRIAFRTKEQSGSQLLIGTSDAMALQGKGDCLLLSEHVPMSRVQAGWVTAPRETDNSDLMAVTNFLAEATQRS